MSYPANLDTIIVRHKVVDSGGRPLKGNNVTAVATKRIWATDGSLIPYETATRVLADGTYEFELPYVDQDGIHNKGVPFQITEHVPGSPRHYFVAPVLAHGTGPIDATEALVEAPVGYEVKIQAGPVTDAAAAQLLAQNGQFAASLKDTIATGVDDRMLGQLQGATATYVPSARWRGFYDPTAAYEAGDAVVYAQGVHLAQQDHATAVTVRTNHIPNPTFRGGQRTGWALGANLDGTFPTSDEITVTANAEKAAGSSLVLPNAGYGATVQPGQVWSFAARAAVPANAPGPVSLRLNLAVIRPDLGNTSVQSPVVTIEPGQSRRLVFDGYTIPEGATEVRPAIMSGAIISTGSTFRTAQFIAEQAPTVGTYFDGASTDTATTDNEWLGPPDASASRQTVTQPSAKPGGAGWANITPQVELQTLTSPVRTAALQPWEPAETLHATYYPSYMCRNDRQTMISYNQYDLRWSIDDGDTWTVAHTFDDIVRPGIILDNGEVLVTTRALDDSRPWEAWLSRGWPEDPTTATWTKVLTATTLEGANPAGFASFSHHGPIIVMGEYGPKTGSQGAAADGARHVYLSRDYGRTWKLIFDLFTDNPSTARTTGMHVHGVCWDPYWDRIWITYGDDENGTVFSDDMGKTWHVADYTSDVTGPNQVVGIIALPKCILFASDGQPNGVLRINRSDGKHTGPYTMEVGYLFDDEPILSTLCQSIWRANRPGDDAPAVFAFVHAPSGQGPWWLLTTIDGYTFNKIWQDPNDTQANQTGNAFGPTVTGQMLFYNYDQTFGASGRTLRRGPMGVAY